jgi:hypothetical protein
MNTSRHIPDDFSLIPEKWVTRKLWRELFMKGDPFDPQFANILPRPPVLIFGIQPEQQPALKPPISMAAGKFFQFLLHNFLLVVLRGFLIISRQTSEETARRADDESGEDTDTEADAETRIFPWTTGDVADDEDNGQDSE